MLGINGKPFINLDQYIDLEGLLLQRLEIIANIAKSYRYIHPGSSGTNYNGYNQTQEDIQHLKLRLEKTQSLPDQLKPLNQIQTYYALKYLYPCYTMGTSLVLRGGIEPKKYNVKNLSESVKILPSDSKFTSLYEWLEKEHIFDQIGRVMFFLSEPFQSGIIHSDYPTLVNKKDSLVKDQFLWIRFDRRKEFFIYDELNDVRHQLTGHVNFFNATDYHGSLPGNRHSFSLRIDGVFSQTFIDKVDDIKAFLTQ
jgi:hypothetical protein